MIFVVAIEIHLIAFLQIRPNVIRHSVDTLTVIDLRSLPN